MPSSPRPEAPRPAARRRRLLLAAGAALLPPLATAAEPAPDPADAAARLRAGGVVLALRHAQAPGTFDPPGFRLDDCRSQRNLDEAGRDQARRLGAWLAAQGLQPARVRSSPWCRCMDTAALAFGRAEPWAALGSPRGSSEAAGAAHLAQLRAALQAAAQRPGRFDAWVTHMFVLSDLVGVGVASGEGLVLDADAQGRPRLLARLALA